jgi:hypothetical protein
MNFELSDLISSISILLSTIAILYALRHNRNEYNKSALAINTSLMTEIEGRIGQSPSLLRFHGIYNFNQALDDAGIKADELAYLINSFTAGATYYRNATIKNRILALDSYRHNMAMSPDTRRAWPLVRKFLAPSEYRDRLDQLMLKN